jgi:transcriptional regulator with XRE-family HTH domain
LGIGNLGTRVRDARKAQQLSQEALAREADLSLNLVNKLERGVVTDPHYSTLSGLARALGMTVEQLVEEPVLAGKAEASETGPLQASQEELAAVVEDKRRLRYLRGWRAFVWKLEHRWRQDPPKTSREIAPLFEVMTALMDEGVFEFSNEARAAEYMDLKLFMEGVRNLNEIADDVEADEEAEERRSALRVIQGQISA